MDPVFPLILGMVMCSLFSTIVTLKSQGIKRMKLSGALASVIGVPLMILAVIAISIRVVLLFT